MTVEVLYIGAGTTAGLREADVSFLDVLKDLGVDSRYVTAQYDLPAGVDRLARRSLLTVDVYESLMLRQATIRAMTTMNPRAIVYSTTHAALLQSPRALRLPTAIRFDTPAQMSRQGAAFAIEHRIERRRFSTARVLLPWGVSIHEDIHHFLPRGVAVVPLPIPITMGGSREDRGTVAVTYAASPHKKGLDLVVEAWQQIAKRGWTLVITGLAREAGLRYLSARGLTEPDDAQWTGFVDRQTFREITRRAAIYISASRYENYGVAQLEALADGATLVTLPSPGAYAALAVVRKCAPQLVPRAFSVAALQETLCRAMAFSPGERHRMHREAEKLLQQHSTSVFANRVASQVLPVLFR